MNREPWTMAGPRVRWRIVPDDEPYDASYVDTWDHLTKEEQAAEKKAIYKQADEDGVWGYEIEVLKDVECPHCQKKIGEEWEHKESCWAFVGHKDAEEACKSAVRALT